MEKSASVLTLRQFKVDEMCLTALKDKILQLKYIPTKNSVLVPNTLLNIVADALEVWQIWLIVHENIVSFIILCYSLQTEYLPENLGNKSF